jgi:hypothetical protein
MLSPAELRELDELVVKAFPNSTPIRLSRPDRISTDGTSKTGYFAYRVTSPNGSHIVYVDWQAEEGKVRILKIRN